MTTILIADRDKNERIGIRWLISSNALPFVAIDIAGNYEEVIQTIEEKTPSIACIEMDMIPKDKWEVLKDRLKRYVNQIIFITTEATFEKAIQAIEVKVEALWVKPLSPANIVTTLKKCLMNDQNHINHQDNSETLIPSEISYQSLFTNQNILMNHYSLLLLQTEDKSKTTQLHQFLQKLDFKIHTMIFPLSDLVVCVVKESNSEFLTFEGNRILKAWDEIANDPLVIVIQTINNEIESLHQAYKHALKALELTFYKGYRQVINVPNKWQWFPLDPFLSSSEQREWVDMLHFEKKEEIKNWMYNQFLSFQKPYPDPGLLRIRLTSILAQIRRFMKTYGIDKENYEDYYHNIFNLILYNPVLYRIVQELLLFIFNLLDGVREKKNNLQLDVVDKAILYIERNFHKPDITLTEVAETVDRSSAYFSHYLSTKLGMTFKQFLTNVRLNEAKRLLSETKLTIKQITVQTGFKNANYFSRIFKEATKMTPTMYRAQNRKENT